MLTGKPEIVDGKPRNGATEPEQPKQAPTQPAPLSPADIIAARLAEANMTLIRLTAAHAAVVEHGRDLDIQRRMAEGRLDELVQLARIFGAPVPEEVAPVAGTTTTGPEAG